jgi:4-diphosphocytidyl-2-C-methyl-D-erythritol kinase
MPDAGCWVADTGDEFCRFRHLFSFSGILISGLARSRSNGQYPTSNIRHRASVFLESAVASSIRVPAKINLWLEVLRKRSDGYHDLSSLMLPIAVYDRIRIEFKPAGPVKAVCRGARLPSGERNLAVRAALRYLEKCGLRSGAEIEIDKDIPVGAGLGGGSADAAGVLLAMNENFDWRLPMEELEGLAAGLGADVPFFLRQRPALASGVGEVLEDVDGAPAYPLLLVKPGMSVSTRWVYESLKLTRGASKIKLNCFKADPWRLDGVIENDLESVTLQEYPAVAGIKSWLRLQGALAALMSGSGPTVFGVFESREQAQVAEAAARERWPDCWVRATRTLTEAEIEVRRQRVLP